MDTSASPPPPPPATSTEDKTVAIVSYFSLIGFIIALVIHQNKKTELGAYHLRQMLGLILFSIPCIIPLLGLLWAMVMFVFWILGLIAAINGQMKPTPLLGPLFQKWFSGVFS